ncbi:MAG: DUF4167 domain-containing protein [Alphaproteobacteria bacterium]|nr:DUF4167 domain-containing protein [Alphaproteobacteria bacterium]
MKRQRGRHNGRKPHHHQPHNPNLPIRSQTFDSNGPDVRVRGNAFQILEKYLALARDAQSAGDRIAAENYYQHAEHYFRLINESGGHQQQRPQQGQPYQGQPDSRYGQQGGEGQGQGGGSMQGGSQGPQVTMHGQGGMHQGNPQGDAIVRPAYAGAGSQNSDGQAE